MKEKVANITTAIFSYTHYRMFYTVHIAIVFTVIIKNVQGWKHKGTMDQELADTAAYAPGRHYVCTHQVEAFFYVR